jgi:hypothetical protein
MFASSQTLQSRARKWIRRELSVFPHLRQTDATSPLGRWEAGQIRNVEFLLEFIVELLKSHDAKDEAADSALRDYLGDDTPLFLHELRSWLRSPFHELEDWDRFMQYRGWQADQWRPEDDDKG